MDSRSLFNVVIQGDETIKASELSSFLYDFNFCYSASLKLSEENPDFIALAKNKPEKAILDLSTFISESKRGLFRPRFKNSADQELLINSISMKSPLEWGFIAIPWAFALGLFIAGVKIKFEDGKIKKFTIPSPLPVIVKSLKNFVSGNLPKDNKSKKR